MIKKCIKCGEEKSLEEYYKHPKKVDGHAGRCKVCVKNDSESGVKRNTLYKSRYGITLDDYNDMFAEQSGCCFICGVHQSELKISLCVDHCHVTNKVRGLLCRKCNSALGLLGDDINILKKAVQYLEEYE